MSPFYSRRLSFLSRAVSLLLVCLAAMTLPARAATYTVNSTLDDNFNPGCGPLQSCTLRQAFDAAESSAGADTIVFDSSIFASSQTLKLDTELPDLTQDTTIIGPNSGLTLWGQNNLQIAFKANSGSIAMSGLTIFNMLYEGIEVNGATVTVINCLFNQNGVGVRSVSGAVNSDGSTFTNNGSGLLTYNAPLFVKASTFNNNTDNGIQSFSASSTIQNSTFLNTQVAMNLMAGTVLNCTVVNNQTGVFAGASGLNVYNTIFAGNSTQKGGLALATDTNNFYGTVAGAGLATSGGAPVLANNGGPSKTIALLPASSSVDAAGDTGLDTDQRGVSRPQGSADDRGAFEIDKVLPIVTITRPTANQTIPPGSMVAGFVNGTASDNAGVNSVAVKLYRTRSGTKQFWNGTAWTTTSTSLNATLGTPSGKNTTWSLDSVPPAGQLDNGAYSVTVSSVDFDGNTSTAVTRNFNISAESTPPVPTITHPAANATLSQQAFLTAGIDGSASDNDALASVTAQFYREGSPRQYWNGSAFTSSVTNAPATVTGLNTASATWKITPLPSVAQLVAGTYGASVTATDLTGNTATVSRAFTIVTDTTAPGVTITHPVANQKIAPNDFSLYDTYGNATDNLGVVSVSLKLYRTISGVKEYWNGTAFTTTSASTSADLIGSDPKNLTWRLASQPTAAQLTPGSYGLQAQAKDAAGLTALATTPFTIASDTEAPVAFVDTPAANQHLQASAFTPNTITGHATDNERVYTVSIKLYRTVSGVKQYWNGSAFGTASVSTNGSLFGSDVHNLVWKMQTPPSSSDLTPTTYSVQVGVKDFAGNSSVFVTRNFVVDAPAALKANGSGQSF